MKTRQPRRTKTQWTEIIEQQSQSGQTIRTFCKENDIGLASFGKWKQKLKKLNQLKMFKSFNPCFNLSASVNLITLMKAQLIQLL